MTDKILEALFTERFGPLDFTPTLEGDAAALTALAGRGVCRRYDPKRAVSDDLLRSLLAIAFSAPTKSDLQQADVIVVRKPEIRAAVLDGVPGGSDWMAEAPVLLVICGDSRRFSSIFESRGEPFANDHFDALFNASVDAAIVLGTLVSTATLAGLGCCPISQIRDKVAPVSAALGLPERIFPVAALTLGYPLDEPWISPRLPLSVTVHEDRFDSAAFDRDGPAYDQRRAAEKPYRRQRDTQRFGEAPLYGWSEDKRRQYTDPQRADFGAYLRAQGFKMD